MAVISALQEIYSGMEVSFCNFHWSQALERNIKSHGLGSYINKRLDLQLFVRSLWSLIFLPADDFAMAFEKIIEDTPLMDKDDKAPEEERESYNQGVKGFLKYFERNYIGEIGEEGRKEPMFKKNYLSKNKRIQEDIYSWRQVSVFLRHWPQPVSEIGHSMPWR